MKYALATTFVIFILVLLFLLEAVVPQIVHSFLEQTP